MVYNGCNGDNTHKEKTMKKTARFVGYAFRYFSYVLGASSIYLMVKDPEGAKEALALGERRGQMLRSARRV